VAAAGRIDGSTKSAGSVEQFPSAALHANAMLRPVFLLSQVVVLVGQAELARFAFPHVGGTAPAPAPAPARFPAGHERFTAPAPCQVTALRYHVLHCHERFTAPARAAVEVKAHWARQVGMVCSFPLFGSIDLPLRNLLSETSMSALQCFYRLGQANVYGKKIQGRNQDPKPHVA
jgi:hypothetical protein